MNVWFTQSDALRVVKVLFWASVVLSLASFLTDTYLHRLLRTYWKPLLVGIALVLIWRIPIEGQFFHGTEYEDSYVYTVAGRQIAGHYRVELKEPTLPYSITVCAVGSLISCKVSDNYPEHLIGYPYFLSVLIKLFGYRVSLGSWANVAFACLVDVFIFLMCVVIADDVLAAGGAALIFAITPIFAVWGLETSAEPFSNGCITLVLWFCLRHLFVRTQRSDDWREFLVWCAFTSTLLFALVVKRENMLLPIALPVVAYLIHFREGRTVFSSPRRLRWLLFSTVLTLIFSVQLHLFQTLSSQVTLLQQFPLTAHELVAFFSVFVGSFFVFQWYGGAIIFVLIGIVLAWRQRRLALFPLALFLGYLLLYALHIRSYYEMYSGATEPRAALRFSMSLMCVWSILAGLGAASIVRWLRFTSIWKNHRVPVNRVILYSVAAVVGVSWYATEYFREDIVRDEFRVRIEPSLDAVRAADRNQTGESYVLTLEPLIPQMYSDASVNIVSLRELNHEVMKDIGFIQGKASVYYLDEEIHRSPADEERYRGQLEYLSHFRRMLVANSNLYLVVRMENPVEGSECDVCEVAGVAHE